MAADVSASGAAQGTGATVIDGAPLIDGYDAHDGARFFAETHRSERDDFARDRARVLHSAGLRRLAAKTQVLSPASTADFARNRLTHSLEVAQVGRELAIALGVSADVVDTACLSHDLGHPPFGHNGERALNDWAEHIGGFEGNAQSLRILTRLEAKVLDDHDRSVGLNLTRASLDATCKYPWTVDSPVPDPGGRLKFGVYPEDEDVFRWMREGAPGRLRCIEAEIMDLSDDIAYSVHDFEDAVVNGYLDVAQLADPAEHHALVGRIQQWVGYDFTREDLADALYRLTRQPMWLNSFDRSRRDLARLKNLTSDMIGRFARAAVAATREAYPGTTLARYSAHVVVPKVIEAEIAVLKGIMGQSIVTIDARRGVYKEQRRVLKRLADALWSTDALWTAGADVFEPAFAADFHDAGSDAQRARVVVDQVASLTDQTAVDWHNRLVGDIDPAEVGIWSPRHVRPRASHGSRAAAPDAERRVP
ncbi:deoxyguanosinetriphosphate triphosphohydrolase [Microbacterium panaciterrae]|uniref:Deoxyguanosinetriphosphate triphosphohydrolase n=1 Tax=Microbacterium panaciterrae TaxID=985759 RepID=A0ABP8P7G2_9MICO